MKLLEYHPVADDVFNVVGHHRRGRAEEINPKIAVGEGRKGAMLGCWNGNGAHVLNSI